VGEVLEELREREDPQPAEGLSRRLGALRRESYWPPGSVSASP
jgi:hypothetical protein